MPGEEWNLENNKGSKLRRECWEVIWPTVDLVPRGKCPKLNSKPKETDFMLFLSPEVVALMEPDILSQLRTYVPSSIAYRCSSEFFPPHLKSYTRLLSKDKSRCGSVDDRTPGIQSVDEEAVRGLGGTSCTCTPLAWFLLTSACLSRGSVFLYLVQLCL